VTSRSISLTVSVFLDNIIIYTCFYCTGCVLLLLVETVALPTINCHNQLGDAVTVLTTGHLHHWKAAIIASIHSVLTIKEFKTIHSVQELMIIVLVRHNKEDGREREGGRGNAVRYTFRGMKME